MIEIVERASIHVPGETSLFLQFDYDPKKVAFIKSLDPTHFHKKEKLWEAPLGFLQVILDEFTSDDDISLKLQAPQPQFIPRNLELGSYITQPFEYQLEGIKHGLLHDKWLLLDEPGLGKTLQMIYLAQERQRREGIKHCLIICGVNTLKENWRKEIKKHSHLSCCILGERTTRTGRTVIGTISQRVEHLKRGVEEFFCITNIETIRNEEIVKQLLLKENGFDMIVVDEIHHCRSHQSQQGANLLKLSAARYCVGLTGTLMMNDPLDAHVPLKWVGAERASYTACKHYYCDLNGDIVCGYKNLDTLQLQLEHYSLRRRKTLLNLPPKNVVTEYVELNPKQEELYEQVKEGIRSQVDKVRLTKKNLLAVCSRLRQVTALPSILTSNPIESSKIERAVDLTEQLVANGDKVVIFSTYKAPVYELQKKLMHLGVVIGTGDQSDAEVNQSVDALQNDPSVNVFVATHERCGTGLTLTKAHSVIFIDTPWTPGDFDQACDRCYRIGTDRPVFIYVLICSNTFDERVWEIVQDKDAIASYTIDKEISDQTIDSLRKYISEI